MAELDDKLVDSLDQEFCKLSMFINLSKAFDMLNYATF